MSIKRERLTTPVRYDLKMRSLNLVFAADLWPSVLVIYSYKFLGEIRFAHLPAGLAMVCPKPVVVKTAW